MGIIGKILGVGPSGIKDPNKLSASERIEARKIKELNKRLENHANETIEKIKTRILEGKSEHVINILMNDKEWIMGDGEREWTGPEFLKYFITLYPGLFSNEDLPTEELKMLNSVNNVNSDTDLETQKQILQLEKEKLAMQLEIERLKQSSNKIEINSTDSKINKLMSWGYSKEKANKVSDEDFERLEYWYNKDRKFFNDLLEIELETIIIQNEQINE